MKRGSDHPSDATLRAAERSHRNDHEDASSSEEEEK